MPLHKHYRYLIEHYLELKKTIHFPFSIYKIETYLHQFFEILSNTDLIWIVTLEIMIFVWRKCQVVKFSWRRPMVKTGANEYNYRYFANNFCYCNSGHKKYQFLQWSRTRSNIIVYSSFEIWLMPQRRVESLLKWIKSGDSFWKSGP